MPHGLYNPQQVVHCTFPQHLFHILSLLPSLLLHIRQLHLTLRYLTKRESDATWPLKGILRCSLHFSTISFPYPFYFSFLIFTYSFLATLKSLFLWFLFLFNLFHAFSFSLCFNTLCIKPVLFPFLQVCIQVQTLTFALHVSTKIYLSWNSFVLISSSQSSSPKYFLRFSTSAFLQFNLFLLYYSSTSLLSLFLRGHLPKPEFIYQVNYFC